MLRRSLQRETPATNAVQGDWLEIRLGLAMRVWIPHAGACETRSESRSPWHRFELIHKARQIGTNIHDWQGRLNRILRIVRLGYNDILRCNPSHFLSLQRDAPD